MTTVAKMEDGRMVEIVRGVVDAAGYLQGRLSVLVKHIQTATVQK